MLQAILSFLIISCFCIVWGFPFIIVSESNKQQTFNLKLIHLIISFFTGLITLSITSAWISIFSPVQFHILVIATIPLLLFNYFLFKKTKRIHLKFDFSETWNFAEKIFFASVIGLIFFLGTGKPSMEDTDLYHLQNTKWIHEFGTVKGLANIYLRYGFYSNWFHLMSLFYLPWKTQNFLYLNSTFCIWAFLFFFYQYHLNKSGTTSFRRLLSIYNFFIIIYLLLDWNLLRGSANSTSYDFIITIGTLISFQLILEVLSKNESVNNAIIYALLIIITAPFFKLTGIFLYLLLIPIFFYNKISRNKIFLSLVLFCITVTPFLIKNYLQSGYPAYPYKFFQIANPDWKVPEAMLSNFNQYIRLSNLHINQTIPKAAFENDYHFSYFNDWFLKLVLLDKLLFSASLISMVLALAVTKKNDTLLQQIKILLLFCLIAIIAWLIMAPNFRFILGFLLVITFLPFSIILVHLFKKWMYHTTLIALTAIICFYIQSKLRSYNSQNIVFVQPVNTPSYLIHSTQSAIFYIPSTINNNWNTRCYALPLPCIYQLNPYLEQRGKDLKDGFRMKQPPPDNFVQNYRY